MGQRGRQQAAWVRPAAGDGRYKAGSGAAHLLQAPKRVTSRPVQRGNGHLNKLKIIMIIPIIIT